VPEWTAAFDKIFAYCLDGVLVARPDGTILSANPAACRALARSEEELRRDGLSGIVEDGGRLKQWLADLARSGSAAGALAFRRADRTTFPAEFTSGILPADDGRAHAYVIFRDITERRLVEAISDRAGRHYRDLFEHMGEGFALHELIFDAEGTLCDSRFVDLNPAWEQLTGVPRELGDRKNHDRDLAGHRTLLAGYLRSGGKDRRARPLRNAERRAAALVRNVRLLDGREPRDLAVPRHHRPEARG
jgi:PAS domain S-box-containing protein